MIWEYIYNIFIFFFCSSNFTKFLVRYSFLKFILNLQNSFIHDSHQYKAIHYQYGIL